MKLGPANNSNKDLYKNYYNTIPGKITINYLNKYKVNVPKHIILRVALDSHAKGRWDDVISRPAVHSLDIQSLRFVVYNFQKLMNPKILLEKIKESNSYRPESTGISKNLIKALEEIKDENRQREV